MPHQCTNCGRTFADGSKEMLSGCPDCSGTKFQFRPEGFDGGGSDPDPDSADDGTGSDDGIGSAVGTPSDTGGSSAAGSSTEEGVVDRTTTATTETGSESLDDVSKTRSDTVSRTVGSAAATVRDLVGGSADADATAAKPPGEDSATDDSPDSATGGGTDDDIIVAESDPVADGTHEDAAQADARSGFATADELPGDPESESSDGDEVETETVQESTSVSDSNSESVPESEPEPESGYDSRTEVSEPDAETADRPDVAELRKELNEQFESIRVVEPGQYELNLMELYDREEYIIALREDGRYSIQVPETWRDADV
jgi:predicted  nucleic acid-binding Zn-ribbon protein